MCNSPSKSGSSSTNAPKLVSFATLPLIICPGIYFSGIARIQGSSVICFIPRDTRRLSSLTSRTMHLTSLPFCTASPGWLYFLVQLKSEICIIPSMPGSISTKTPKLVRLRTVAVRIVPEGYFWEAIAHGFTSVCFNPNEISCFSLLTSNTTTSISSPRLTISPGCARRLVQLISLICTSPSTPSSSRTNTP